MELRGQKKSSFYASSLQSVASCRKKSIFRAFLPHQFVWVETDVWWCWAGFELMGVASNYGYNYTVCVLSPKTVFRAPGRNTVWDGLGKYFGGRSNPASMDLTAAAACLNPNVGKIASLLTKTQDLDLHWLPICLIGRCRQHLISSLVSDIVCFICWKTCPHGPHLRVRICGHPSCCGYRNH